jgi:hypothetical protein
VSAAKESRRGCFAFAGGVGVTLAVLGGLFVLVVAVIGGLVGYAVYAGVGLDKSSKAYVDEAVPAIVTNWSLEELKKRSSPAMLKASSDEDLMKMFTICRRLGALKSYGGCEGDSRVFFTPQGKTISATYIAHAKFENGDAEIKVLLIQLDGQWKIQGFHVDSSALIKQ